jgi:AmpE protein
MKLLALLIGLIVERLATQLFHLRRLRWLDRAIDSGFRQADRFANLSYLIPVVILISILIAPVLLARWSVGDTLYGFPYLILAIFVLFFSLGPKDIGEDVDEYCRAIELDDADRIRETAKALIETDVPEEASERIRRVEESVCIQANNRLFAVIFWFVLLGPVGAWAYRVTDLVRRRAVFNALRAEQTDENGLVSATEALHGWLAWIPARLTAVGFAMAGNFDGARSAWRTTGNSNASTSRRQSERLLATVGTGALALVDEEGESQSQRGIRGAIAANGLVYRSLLIWAVVIGAMTLYGWSV